MTDDPKKYLKFLETVKDDKCKIHWEKDMVYEIIFENDDHYRLLAQNGIKCGIDKAFENKLYVVIYAEG